MGKSALRYGAAKCTGVRICKHMASLQQREAGAGVLEPRNRRSSLPLWIFNHKSFVVIAPVAPSIAGFADLKCWSAEKMKRNTLLSRWPATPPQFQLLTTPSSYRSSSPTAFHHSHPGHVCLVQMFTLACFTLHLYNSNILFLQPASGCLMLAVATSRLTALFSLYS
jgi:hypothetical protein